MREIAVERLIFYQNDQHNSKPIYRSLYKLLEGSHVRALAPIMEPHFPSYSERHFICLFIKCLGERTILSSFLRLCPSGASASSGGPFWPNLSGCPLLSWGRSRNCGFLSGSKALTLVAYLNSITSIIKCIPIDLIPVLALMPSLRTKKHRRGYVSSASLLHLRSRLPPCSAVLIRVPSAEAQCARHSVTAGVSHSCDQSLHSGFMLQWLIT